MSQEPRPAVGPDRVLIPLFSALTGYTEKAVRRKIEERVWVEGVHWFRNPDGRITLSLRAYEKWQTTKPAKPRPPRVSNPEATASA